MDQWVRVDDSERARGARPVAGAQPPRRGRPTEPQPLPADVATEIRRAAESATAHHREVLVGRMERAVAAYDHNRFQEAARLTAQVVDEARQVPAVRRLAGFANYRMGRWREAVRQFEAYRALTDDAEVLPALMDCQRALGRHNAVIALWAELRQAGPDADALAEARIVAAGSLADRGELSEAIEVLASGGAGRSLRNPSERHLRQWYALADLYERAGDVPRARTLFTRVALVDPEAYDVAERLSALGQERRSRPSRSKRRPGVPGRGTGAAGPAAPPGESDVSRAAPRASGAGGTAPDGAPPEDPQGGSPEGEK